MLYTEQKKAPVSSTIALFCYKDINHNLNAAKNGIKQSDAYALTV